MRIGVPGGLRGLDDLGDLLGAADVAGVQPDAVRAGGDRLQRERVVEVDVGDDRNRRLHDDRLQRLDVLVARDGDADDVRSGLGDLVDLSHRRLEVGGLGLRHRLHDDRGAAADRDAADDDLSRGCHVRSFYGCESGPRSRSCEPRAFVFGYGSLAGEHERCPVARLRGWRRVWGVAMDNSVDIPGYKSYSLRSDGSRPAVFVAFLDIEPDPTATVTGVCMPVDAADLRALDDRERSYDRVDITEQIEGSPPGRVWAYRGSEAGRARLREGLARGRAVVSRDYLDAVLAGVATISPEEVAAVARSPADAGLEVFVPRASRDPRRLMLNSTLAIMMAVRRMMIQADDGLLDRAKRRAADRGVSVAQVVRDALERELGPAAPAPEVQCAGAFRSGQGDLARRAADEYVPPPFRS